MKKPKHQIIYIHGAEAFKNKQQFYTFLKTADYNPYAPSKKRWCDWLAEKLKNQCEIFMPSMPNKQWADYMAWKIWFEKLFPYIHKSKESKIILIGGSMGGIFLAKYLSENTFPKHIDQIHLVSAPFDDKGIKDESLKEFTPNPRKLKNLEMQTDHLFLYHSSDDLIVPISHAQKFLKYLTKAIFFEFHNRGHFSIPTFPEILKTIKKYL